MVCLATVFTAQAQDSGDLLGRINSLRAQHGLPGYSINGALTVAAQQQAQWIVDNANVSHTHPDGSGPRTRAIAAGYPSTQISENIYGGTNASVNSAWTFWINSPIHFNGLVSPNYQEVGIGIAQGGWGSAYVLVFGGVGAPPPAPGSGSSGTGQQGVAAGPPPYIGGVDDHGNIKHIVQPGDTLGDIALIYGYTWSDLPYMMQLNGLSDVRDLDVGSTFLVPPKDGTYTPPAPDTSPPASPPTETPVPTAIPPTITPFVLPTDPPQIAPTIPIATAGSDILPPDADAGTANDSTQIAALPTPSALRAAAVVPPRATASTWIMIAVGVQVLVVVGAGIEFLRRALRKRW